MASRSEQPGPGDRLGPYRIVRTLGSGGMGTVHEAVEEPLGRSVALKLIAPAYADDPVFREQLTREAQAQAGLDSPHVVQVFAHGEVDRHLFIASQLVPDGDLRDLLRRHGALPPALALDLVAQVADGLAEAHRAGLVHRDIKPSNVLLRDRGDALAAYLTDFGLARSLDGPKGDGAGTPAYMAPELFGGAPATVASDVYALGCLLFAAFTGAPPWTGPDPEVERGHLHAPVPRLPGRGRLAREVDRILRTALAKDPAERYVAVELFRDDVLALRVLRDRPARRVLLAAATATAAAAAAGAALTMSAPHTPIAPAQQDGPAVTRLAARLQTEAHLAPEAARCTARHALEQSRSRTTAGPDVQAVFVAGFTCLWPDEEVTDR